MSRDVFIIGCPGDPENDAMAASLSKRMASKDIRLHIGTPRHQDLDDFGFRKRHSSHEDDRMKIEIVILSAKAENLQSFRETLYEIICDNSQFLIIFFCIDDFKPSTVMSRIIFAARTHWRVYWIDAFSESEEYALRRLDKTLEVVLHEAGLNDRMAGIRFAPPSYSFEQTVSGAPLSIDRLSLRRGDDSIPTTLSLDDLDHVTELEKSLRGMMPKEAISPVSTEMEVSTVIEEPQADLVDVSAFAPEGGQPGSQILVQIFLHSVDVLKHHHEIVGRAREADPETRRRGVATLATAVERNKRIEIVLEGQDVNIDEPSQFVIWRGEPCACQFLVKLPLDRDVCYLRARVVLDDIPVGALYFVIKITSFLKDAEADLGFTGELAARYRYAFLSYATPNRPEVVKRAQALRAVHIKFFQDVLTIEPGEKWEQRLYEEIDRCDLFLLFWSSNAAKSQWVRRETERAVARQNASNGRTPDITPVIIEGPPIPGPIPESLKHLHFNDHLTYFIDATVREQEERKPESSRSNICRIPKTFRRVVSKISKVSRLPFFLGGGE